MIAMLIMQSRQALLLRQAMRIQSIVNTSDGLTAQFTHYKVTQIEEVTPCREPIYSHFLF